MKHLLLLYRPGLDTIFFSLEAGVNVFVTHSFVRLIALGVQPDTLPMHEVTIGDVYSCTTYV